MRSRRSLLSVQNSIRHSITSCTRSRGKHPRSIVRNQATSARDSSSSSFLERNPRNCVCRRRCRGSLQKVDTTCSASVISGCQADTKEHVYRTSTLTRNTFGLLSFDENVAAGLHGSIAKKRSNRHSVSVTFFTAEHGIHLPCVQGTLPLPYQQSNKGPSAEQQHDDNRTDVGSYGTTNA